MSLESAISYEEALENCRSALRQGSKSFSLAARLFNRDIQNAVMSLYGWCRHCDDEIDGSTLGFQNSSPALQNNQASDRLARLKDLTQRAYSGEPMTHPVFVAFQHVVKKYDIPLFYPMELLEGMGMDVRNERYENWEDLHLYCYRVAGVVGLMMTHVMGIDNEEALERACDMGVAMQLTNIARDVAEDAGQGRVYIPQSWLKEFGIQEDEILQEKNRTRLFDLISRLLAEAEKRYHSGDQGVRHLSFRAALSIVSARAVYSEIGNEILRRGAQGWTSRVVTRTTRKLWVMMPPILNIIFDLPRRWLSPWKPIPIKTIWRFS